MSEALQSPESEENVSRSSIHLAGGEDGKEVENFDSQVYLDSRKTMPWMEVSEMLEIDHVEKIRESIRDYLKREVMLPPEINQRALNYMTDYYARAMQRASKAKAMMDEHLSRLVMDDPELPTSRAKIIVQGTEFGRRATFYKSQAETYKEMVQTLKKNISYFEGEAKNQY